ncbi:MAG: hypothetical protein PWP64_764 [Candidatus Cloacimonadota bacterium]|nr:hypothetical protein [Candidatus Cloacimonadota bacterium]
MKQRTCIFVLLIISAVAFAAQEIPYPVDSPEYSAYKQSLIGQAGQEPRSSAKPANAHPRKYSREAREGLLIPLDEDFELAMSGNDDSSSSLISMPFVFDFYGDMHSAFYINNNGNVSFGNRYGAYSSTGFPVSGYPMLAGFWADVDTRPAGGGEVWYKVEEHRVTVIWDAVGYYSNGIDKLNTFEIIFTDGTDPVIGLGNNVALSYGDMQWTTGSASGGSNGFGGTPATVGINKGDGENYAQIGRFDHEGMDYDGPHGAYDGVSWLDNQLFTFSAQTGIIPPYLVGVPSAPLTLEVGESAELQINALSATSSYVNATVEHDFESGFSFQITPGNPCAINLQITGMLSNMGSHTITITAMDDNEPPLTAVQSFEVQINEHQGDFLLVVNRAPASIYIVDVATDEAYGPFLEGELGTGDLLDAEVSADGQFALVSNFYNHTVYHLDLSNLMQPSVIAAYSLGFGAEDISLSYDDRYALVADGGTATHLAVIDLQARTTVQNLDISPHQAQGVELSADGKVLVNDYTNNAVYLYHFDYETATLSYSGVSVSIDAPLNTAIHPSGDYAIVCSYYSDSYVLDLREEGNLELLYELQVAAQSAIYSPDGTTAVIGQYGSTNDVLAVYSVQEGGMLELLHSYSLPTDSEAGYYGVDVVAIATDKSKAYVSGYYGEANAFLTSVDLHSHELQHLNLVDHAGICIGNTTLQTFLQAYFTVEVTNTPNSTQVQFNNQSLGMPDSYLWDFGDGGSSTETDPFHEYTTPGVYNVTLTAFKGSNSHSYSIAIEASFNANVHLTLAGSPYNFNGDLIISEASVLSIDEGVELNFAANTGIEVYGRIMANGVSFAGAEPQGWNGVLINSTQSPQLFDNCNISNALTGLHIIDADFTLNHLYVHADSLLLAADTGLRLEGACTMILNDIEVEGYPLGIVFDNQSRSTSSPVLSNIRIRNTTSASRTLGTGLQVIGAVALQMDDAEFDEYDTGIDWDAAGTEFVQATPVLTNIRIRNTTSASRAPGQGIKLSNISNVRAEHNNIQGYDEGLIIDNQEYAGSSNTVLSNIRIRNTSSASRTTSRGIYLRNIGTVQAQQDSISGFDQGFVLDNQEYAGSSSAVLANIRIRNTSSASRNASQGVYLRSVSSVQAEQDSIAGFVQGFVIDNQEYAGSSNAVLANIRIRNTSSASREDVQGVVLQNVTNGSCSRLLIHPEQAVADSTLMPSNLNGRAIIVDGGNANISQSTIWGFNKGLKLAGGAAAALVQSVIWSGSDIPLTEPVEIESGTANVTQSNISYAAGEYPGENNINEDPLFANPEEGNFYPMPRSPLIANSIGALDYDYYQLAEWMEEYSFTFEPGWSMMGMPIILAPGENTPVNVLGDALSPFYVHPYYTSILQLNTPETLAVGHLSFTENYLNVPQELNAGIGYWIRNPQSVAIEVPVYGILDTLEYVLDLESGIQDHFMLANPYDRPICAANGSIEVLGVSNFAIVYNPDIHGYEPVGIAAADTTSIGAWKAFFVQKTATPAQVKFCYPDSPGTERHANFQETVAFSTKPQEPEWELLLAAKCGDFAGKAVVGIAPAAIDGYDPMDVMALPPLPFAPVGIINFYSDNNDWQQQAGNYIRDIKANDGNFWSWELMLDIQNLLENGRFNGTVEIGILETQKPLAGYSLSLIDPNGERIVDLQYSPLILQLDINANNSTNGETPWLIPLRLEVSAISAAEEEGGLLATYNFPNPFNPSTTISFNLGKESQVSLDIYNVKGQKVRSLYQGIKGKGIHKLIWDGKDDTGRETSSGFYFYRLQAGNEQLTRKILMLK